MLEEHAVPYIIVAHMTTALNARLHSLALVWRDLGKGYAVSSFTLRLHGWSDTRRFVVVRELGREDKSAVGRRLIDVPGYTFRVWVTNRTEDSATLWRDYNGQATIEQRIEELKNDMHADGFCTRKLTHPPPHGGFALRAACGFLSHLLPAGSALRDGGVDAFGHLRLQPARRLSGVCDAAERLAAALNNAHCGLRLRSRARAHRAQNRAQTVTNWGATREAESLDRQGLRALRANRAAFGPRPTDRPRLGHRGTRRMRYLTRLNPHQSIGKSGVRA
jgi:hypothetical protein